MKDFPSPLTKTERFILRVIHFAKQKYNFDFDEILIKFIFNYELYKVCDSKNILSYCIRIPVSRYFTN